MDILYGNWTGNETANFLNFAIQTFFYLFPLIM